MGFFEFRKDIIERKKERLIKKLGVVEEKAQKRSILEEKQREVDSLKNQINIQKGTASNIGIFKGVNVGKGLKEASIGVAKGVESGVKASVNLFGKMAENQKAFEEKQEELKKQGKETTNFGIKF